MISRASQPCQTAAARYVQAPQEQPHLQDGCQGFNLDPGDRDALPVRPAKPVSDVNVYKRRTKPLAAPGVMGVMVVNKRAQDWSAEP